ncbi:MAG: FMN-binding glutamate synthase family protein [Alphaproteobacteria bacterium]|nr:FMN-binding glutamate synthase family protein [Alphaproteobacteria bacterium]MCB9696159.1 FMN-binding glutamate synthase family protein [Alphaproteobacteria bacterium]
MKPDLPLRVTERAIYHRVPDFLDHWSRRTFTITAVGGVATLLIGGVFWWPIWVLLLPWLALVALGVRDMNQNHHAVLRNYPVLGHLRYLFESLRPEIRQYFVEDDREQTPFSRQDRSLVYQRAKEALETQPFGTRRVVYEVGYEFVSHSLYPKHAEEGRRVKVGGPECKHPYQAALLNVSAMSFGSLSPEAIRALNQGARIGGFYHNTGEGGISPYHLEPGGDLVWQIGTGYFGCRNHDGGFDAERFKDNAHRPAVKMIEVKLSQGAKPAHGGILPASKLTPEIAAIRGVPMGRDVLSPPGHTAFDGPTGLLEFVAHLRELSGGKPVGFKLCVGNPVEWLTICHAMRKTGLRPDFITIDGAEGGTGAAPVEFSDFVGTPLDEGLSFVHDTLVGADLRDDIVLISAGKIASGFHVVRQLALGADLCNAARAMMFALGCIQALKCNTNRCPVGVATQDPELSQALDVPNKAARVASFQTRTVNAAMEIVGAVGLPSPEKLRRYHVSRRISPTEVRTLAEIYPDIPKGALLTGEGPIRVQRLWELAGNRL